MVAFIVLFYKRNSFTALSIIRATVSVKLKESKKKLFGGVLVLIKVIIAITVINFQKTEA